MLHSDRNHSIDLEKSDFQLNNLFPYAKGNYEEFLW